MDFRHLIVTCLFSMLRLSFETQKIKENYAIFSVKVAIFLTTRKAQVTCYIKWVACSCVYRGLATPNRKKNSSPLLF